jgi:cell division septal protein FtsQ
MVAGRRGTPAPEFAVRRRPRHRRRPPLVKAAVAVAAVALAAAALAWILTADLFAVARVETGPYRFSDETELETALADLLRRNIWRVGRDDVARVLAPLPWIRDLQISRRLPRTLAVEIREWRPLLEVVPSDATGAGSGPLVLVEDGRVLAFPAHLPAPGLPVLVGMAAPRDSTGVRRLGADQLAATLAVLSAIETTGLEAAAPVDFLIARPEGFAIVLQGGRGRLLVGRTDFADRLQRYMIARDHLEEGLEVDLRFGDRITVRQQETR